MAIKPELVSLLACPACKGELEHDEANQKLVCNACRLKFAIEDDIPIMLVEEAERF